jgi:hypothetical protein
MKITATLCDSGGFWDAATTYAKEISNGVEGLTKEERNFLLQERAEDALRNLRPWVGYEEQITIEFDLDNQTATVVKRQ